jgi:hypothetical protein
VEAAQRSAEARTCGEMEMRPVVGGVVVVLVVWLLGGWKGG